SGLNGIVDNSRFTDNEATYGGAVFLQNCAHGTDTNVSITDSYFENNTASEDGGAINWHLGTNATVDTSTFVNNTAIRGGALFINGSDGNVKGSNFTANEAILGGSVYLNNEGLTIGDSKFSENVAVQGGAIYVGADNNNIAGSSFNYNNATYTFRVSTTGNDNKTKGGAIYVNGENTVIDNSKFYNNTAVATTSGGVLDDGLGGAVFIEADNNNVTSSEFDWNVARNGSAIYNDASGSYFENDTLIKNQAWSYTLDVNATPNSTYLGLSVSIKVENYTGGDNILNGMYNAKTVNDVTFKDVTYIINSDESQKVQTVNSNPVLGAVNSDGGVLLYQDSLERYQKIIVEFIDKQTGEVVAVRTVRTDLYGNNTFDISDLTPGNYTVKAYHPEDRN
ncbi:MAG: hypothetical protein IJ672_06745, partial [Methanobrevibacter sp.]|nr:hypothetical protein [Methanobrevibacter sp.]